LNGSGVTKPATNIIGMTYQVKTAPPVKKTSITFIADSITTIDMKDIPITVRKAFPNPTVC